MASPRSPQALQQMLETAVGYLQSGNTPAAELVLTQIIDLKPKHFDALHLLGVCRAMAGQLVSAEALVRQASRLKPDWAEAHGNLGNILKDLGRPDEALASYDKALALNPRVAEMHCNRGLVLNTLGRAQDALASYDKALALRPGYADAHCNKGSAEHELGRIDAALASYDRAIALEPGSAVAHSNKANTLLACNRPEEALASCQRAIAIDPAYADAYNNLGATFARLQRHEQALESYAHALRLRPDYPEAYHNRGSTFEKLAQHEAALDDFDHAIALRPAFTDALFSRSILLASRHRLPEAIASCESLVNIAPEYPLAIGTFAYLKQHVCDWSGFDATLAGLSRDIRAGHRSIAPGPGMALLDSAEDQLSCARKHSATLYPLTADATKSATRHHHDRLRIAYISPDFRDHAVSILMAGVFEQHDRNRFDVTAISLRPGEGGRLEQRVRNAFEHFIDVSRKSDAEVAALLRSLEIDIAVDLAGHSTDGRMGIMAQGAAPIQVNYLGYPGSSGADCIDYIIADAFVVPEDKEVFYSEKIARLPDCFQANDDLRSTKLHAPARIDAGLPESGFVFCAFNNTYKITPRLFDIWMRLLHSVPGSVLWLAIEDTTAIQNLGTEATKRGVDPSRLVFSPRVAYDEHLARFQLADLFLDTLPFNAGTTASDALWAGVPVLTCAGDAFAGRMAGSLLQAMGLPELITHSLAEYESLARTLALDTTRLCAIRARLAAQRTSSALFNTRTFTRNIEAAYGEMWRIHERGEPPRSFSSPAS